MEILSSLPSCARQPCDFRRNQPRRSSGEAASVLRPWDLSARVGESNRISE